MTFVQLTKKEALINLRNLVKQFRENIEQYKNKDYNEASLRKDYLDRLIKEVLGWDLENKKGLPEQYKEVLVEPPLEIEESKKVPDYCFRMANVRKFFVEAKKPSENIQKNEKHAYQLREYGWNAELSVSILTDFEEFAVYDCRIKPKHSDKADVARLIYWRFDEYEKNFDELYDTYSHEALWTGSFDKFIKESKTKRGTLPVSQDILSNIEHWRELLAKNIALRNYKLGVYDLNYAVQTIINRILFLRICEDLSIESYERLKNISSQEHTYKRLMEYFNDADDKYNSGIFDMKEDKITSSIEVDNKILNEIILDLYFPRSSYKFDVIGVEILGRVYEQFLGKIIHLTLTHHARIEEKPEVKKAGGIFYTPKYIVDYIVKDTVGKKIKDKSPKEIEQIKILDPACGSGTFLISAYAYLLDYHLEFYKKFPQKYKKEIYQIKTGKWLLSTEVKKKILLNNIYGVDTDAQAVEVTKLSLLLKVLENETKESVNQQLKLIRERVLPNINNNIKCGNSLIDSSFYREVQMNLVNNNDTSRRINIFDWNDSVHGFGSVMKEGKFDIVIGNPPYIQIQKLKEFYPEETLYYQKNYETAKNDNVDIYVIFIQKGLSLLKEKGVLGYICPNRFFNSEYGNNLRNYLKKYSIYQLVNFRHYFVFDNADTYTCLLFLENKKQSEFLIYKEIRGLYKDEQDRVNHLIYEAKKPEDNFVIDEIKPHFLNEDKWYFMTTKEEEIFEKITKNKRFSDYYEQNFQGLITGVDDIFILKLVEDKGKTRIFFSKRLNKNVELESEITFNIIGDGDLDNYYIKKTEQYILFPYKAGKLLSDEEIKKYKLSWEYINNFKKELQEREKGKFKNDSWYQYSRNQAIDKQTLSKILVPHVIKHTRSAIDEEGKIFIKNVGVNGVTLKKEIKEDKNYILAILNSNIASFFISKISIFLSGGFYATNKQFAGEIPIKKIDFSNKNEKSNHDKIVELVSFIIKQKKSVNEHSSSADRERQLREISAMENEVNNILYELYGISEEKGEKKIIEESLK